MGQCGACTSGVTAHWMPVMKQKGPFPLTADPHTIQSLPLSPCPLTLPGWTQAYEHATWSQTHQCCPAMFLVRFLPFFGFFFFFPQKTLFSLLRYLYPTWHFLFSPPKPLTPKTLQILPCHRVSSKVNSSQLMSLNSCLVGDNLERNLEWETNT